MTRPVTLLLVGAAALAACHGQPPAEAVVARNACTLVSAGELAALAGEPVTAESTDSTAERTRCVYWDSTHAKPVVQLTVYWQGGRDRLETAEASQDLSPSMLDQPNAAGDSVVEPGPVPGLGDEAYFSDIFPSYVLSGDRLIEVFVTYLPEARARFVPLLRTILGRL